MSYARFFNIRKSGHPDNSKHLIRKTRVFSRKKAEDFRNGRQHALRPLFLVDSAVLSHEDNDLPAL